MSYMAGTNKPGRRPNSIIPPDVIEWRNKMRRYRVLKADIAKMISDKGWDHDSINHWLKSPTPALGGRSPKQLMNPRSINKLHHHAKKILK